MKKAMYAYYGAHARRVYLSGGTEDRVSRRDGCVLTHIHEVLTTSSCLSQPPPSRASASSPRRPWRRRPSKPRLWRPSRTSRRYARGRRIRASKTDDGRDVARTTRPGRRSIDRSRTRISRVRERRRVDGDDARERARDRADASKRNISYRFDAFVRARSVAGEPASSSSSRWSRVDPRDRSEFSSNWVEWFFVRRAA